MSLSGEGSKSPLDASQDNWSSKVCLCARFLTTDHWIAPVQAEFDAQSDTTNTIFKNATKKKCKSTCSVFGRDQGLGTGSWENC